ncbi:MAG: restriction endonuclease subunit S [Verrucomicrobia bacterium]|nr:restriction endonuclease subunit S [Verrucomicrobiota bacterium]
MRELGEVKPRNSVPDDVEVSFVPMAVISDKWSVEIDAEERVWKDVKKGYTHLADGDVALAKITPCFQNGKSCVFKDLKNGFGAGTTELHILRPNSDIVEPKYILCLLKSHSFRAQGVKLMTGSAGQKRVPAKYFAEAALLLPPVSEQKRIVSKVDSLMALCDELEERQTRAREVRVRLGEAAHAKLAGAKDQRETSKHWNFLQKNFQALEVCPENVSNLRKTILQLAVAGRLVPRSHHDEAMAFMLMEDLAGRKNMKNGLSLRESPLPTGYRCLRLSAMKGGLIDCSESKYVPLTKEQAEAYQVNNGDVFLTRGNGSKQLVGRAGIVTSSSSGVIFPDLFIRVPLNGQLIDSNYFLVAWNSPQLRVHIERVARTTSGIWKINQGHVAETRLPVPPLAQQKRIVAKVDELMALCDELERKLKQAEVDADRLFEAVVAGITAG